MGGRPRPGARTGVIALVLVAAVAFLGATLTDAPPTTGSQPARSAPAAPVGPDRGTCAPTSVRCSPSHPSLPSGFVRSGEAAFLLGVALLVATPGRRRRPRRLPARLPDGVEDLLLRPPQMARRTA